MIDRSHEELKSLVAPYALGALPADELRVIRDHILSCEECMAEADAYADASAALALAVDPVEVPPGFTDRVVTAAVGQQAAEPAARRAPRRAFPRLQAWAAAGALLVLGVLSALLIDARSDLSRAERELRAARAESAQEERVVTALLHARGGWDLEGAGGVVGKMVPTRDGALLALTGLREPPQGHAYQLWLLKGDRPVSGGVFDVDEGLALVRVGETLTGYTGAAVTVEPRGGSPRPTSDPIITSA